MTTRPAVIGGFIVGAIALAVAAIIFFGSVQLFGKTFQAVVFFNESVAGLEVGAPVTFHGVRVGSVKDISVQFSGGTMSARIPVIIEIEADRITWEGKKLDTDRAEYERLIAAGLRAQLAMQSLVTGQLSIDLDFHPTSPAHLVGAIANVREIPTIPSELGQLRNQLANLPLRDLAEVAQRALAAFERLSDHVNARLDPLVDSVQGAGDAATGTFYSANDAIVALRKEATKTLLNLDSLLADARSQVNGRGSELSRLLVTGYAAVQRAQILLDALNSLTDGQSTLRSDMEAMMRDLAASASSLRGFASTIERHPNAVLMGRSNP